MAKIGKNIRPPRPRPSPTAERLTGVGIRRAGEIYGLGSRFTSHWQLRAAMGDTDPQHRTRGDIEGFITSSGRFVTREEAKPIGVASGQLSPAWSGVGRELLSSDINWSSK